ncbi:hypothetical protein JYK00_07570 [Thermosipho ferrireducens]|uniref:Uncharacterized protein n=1 Tax=Thermosipho ferrireducens TaxID=2571116 RepID=A0ABX7S521_9BACT|nr:hypothetical protein [Thermosipho ferrireducens]QTA37582.1 hypothetical protein JYK00_07570 [Thermosipho ferrireducens]
MKTPKEVIIKEISDDLITYVKNGHFSPNTFLRKLNLNIENFERLIKLHFILLDEVREYVKSLPFLIRTLKVSSSMNEQNSRESIKGKINWQKTIKERLNVGYNDKTLFSVSERNKEYNTKENIVLKKFIEILYTIIHYELNMVEFEKYEWYKDGKEINRIVKDVYEKNIYLNKVDTGNIKITNRMLENVKRNRNYIYNKTAKLFKLYRDYLSFKVNKLRLKELFEKTFIEIADENTLFELYWVIKVIKNYQKDYKMYIMDVKENKVATWEDNEYLYIIYHNSTGSNELVFKVYRNEIEDSKVKDEFFKRQVMIFDQFRTIGSKLFDDREISENVWQGRPDILIEIRDTRTYELKKVIIGEVKYTTDKSYILQGLKELLEYIYFLKDKNGEFIYRTTNQKLEVKGILFTDRIEHDYINNELVQVISYGSNVKF